MGKGIRDKFVFRMPKRKKRLPAGQIGNIFDECFRSVPREAAFLRLDCSGFGNGMAGIGKHYPEPNTKIFFLL